MSADIVLPLVARHPLKLAIVVVNFNCAATLMRCLECIRGQSHPASRVIVVDNASVDGSALTAAAAYPDIEFVSLTRNTGFAAANNLAVSMVSECDWIALVNPDAFLAPNWVEEMLGATERHPSSASFGARLMMDGEASLLDGVGDAVHISGLVWRRCHGRRVSDGLQGEQEVFSCCAAAALYHREKFVAVAGFDETFFCYVEDVDLGYRLRLAGYSCWYVPSAVAVHIGSISSGGQHSDFAVFHGHRNLVWCFVKNTPTALFALFFPLHFSLNILTVLIFSLRGMGGVALRAKFHAVLGLPRAWRQRRSIQKARRASVRDIWRVLDKCLWRSI